MGEAFCCCYAKKWPKQYHVSACDNHVHCHAKSAGKQVAYPYTLEKCRKLPLKTTEKCYRSWKDLIPIVCCSTSIRKPSKSVRSGVYRSANQESAETSSKLRRRSLQMSWEQSWKTWLASSTNRRWASMFRWTGWRRWAEFWIYNWIRFCSDRLWKGVVKHGSLFLLYIRVKLHE